MYSTNQIRTGLIVFLVFIGLTACGGDGGSDGGSSTGKADFTPDCNAVSAYVPTTQPQITTSTLGAATTSLIIMHGKNGSPYGSHLQSFYTDMAAKGYDVIAPNMPWAGTAWDGTLCEAMVYIDQLAAAEITLGKNVVVVGHSMGGVHALIYGASEPPVGVQAIVAIAPGHMPHLSTKFQNETAADVSRAKSMVSNGQGDQIDSFITLNSGTPVTLNTTPNIYLSYHALDQYPNIYGVLPKIDLPVMWIAGDTDRLTTIYGMASLAGEITSSDSDYQLLNGTHLGVVANTPIPLGVWLNGLGI